MAPPLKYPNKNIDAAYAAFDEGAEAKDLVREGFSKSAAYKWFTKWKKERNEPPPVKDVEVPPPVRSATDPTPSAKKGGITEKTAGQLLQMGFALWASMAKNDICYLTPAQTAMLQGPFAETMKSIPSPVAGLVNQYAPPIAFVTSLVGVIGEKQEQMRLQAQREYTVEATAARHDASMARAAESAREEATTGEQGRPVPENMRQSTGTPEPPAPSFFER